MILERSTQELFEADELMTIEAKMPGGISSQEVISLFQERGVRLSEATFRKYVQLGLLPTSKRVGRKGKHRGSRGVYPVSVVRRINLIKALMQKGMTLEEIRDSFISIQNDIERVNDAIADLFLRIEERIEHLRHRGELVKPIVMDVATVRAGADRLLKKIERIGSSLAVAGPIGASSE